MLSNNKLNFLLQNKNDELILEWIYFLSQIATLSNDTKNDDSDFYNDIVEVFNFFISRKGEDFLKKNKKQIDQILLVLENYSNIKSISNYKITSLLYDESKEFSKKYINNFVENNFLLTEKQRKIFLSILDETNDIYSMPTSFGKSFIIKLVAIYRANLGLKTIICVPTLALIHEYRRDFSIYNKHEGIKISSSPENEESMIYVLTQERLLDYKITSRSDLLIIDEAYELLNKNLRSAILKSLCNHFLKNGNHIKLFQPNLNLDKFTFINEWFLNVYKINSKISTQIVYLFNKDVNNNIKNITLKSIKNNEKIAIYSYKYKHWHIAENISEGLDYIDLSSNEWFSFLEEIYTEDYLPCHFLKKGIIISNGDIPRIFRYIVEKNFKANKKIFNVIICNNTLSKGVNLEIKNLIVNAKNSMSKNNSVIDKFEIKNLFGRVGRITNNLLDRIGNVYICLSDKKTSKEIEKLSVNDNIEYVPNNSKEDITKYEKIKSDVANGKLKPWKYVLDHILNENNLYDIFENNRNAIVNFYSKEKRTEEDFDNFFNFLIELYGGEKNFIKLFFVDSMNENSYNLESKLQNQNFVDYYINIRTKLYIFGFIFKNIEIKDILDMQMSYYKEKNYYFNGSYLSKKHKEGYTLIKNITKKSTLYSKLITRIINDIIKASSKFYESNFRLVEKEIINFLKNKCNIELKEIDSDIKNIVDEYNIPFEMINIFKKNNIKTIDEFKKSRFYNILI